MMFYKSLIKINVCSISKQKVLDNKEALKEEYEKNLPESFSRLGDNGTSKTIDGTILPKDNQIFNAIGATEELLSFLG